MKIIKSQLYKTILSLMVLCSACGSKPDTAGNSATNKPKPNSNIVTLTPEQERNAGLDTGRAGQHAVDSTLKVTGMIDVPPQNLVSISFPLGGYLKSTQLLPGMRVTKGEAIATIEDQQYIQLQQDYLTTKARLAYSGKEYERQRDLNASKASSDKVYQQAQAEYQSEQVALRSLAEKLRLIGFDPARLNSGVISRQAAVRSPISGFVSKVNVNIGKYVNPTDVLFEIVDPSDIHLALDIFEKDLNRLKVGLRVTAWTNANPNRKYQAKIVLIGKDLTGDRKTQVHCHLQRYDASLIPGTYMNAEIAVQTDNSLSLPEAAVVNYQDKSYVFLVRGQHRYEMVELKAGLTRDGYVQMDDNRFKNTKLVIAGAYSLLMKLKNTDENE